MGEAAGLHPLHVFMTWRGTTLVHSLIQYKEEFRTEYKRRIQQRGL